MGNTHDHVVLVVDDDEDIVTALVMFLESAGFTAEGVTSAEAALARLRAGFRPCSMVVDILMPARDGWALVAELRADPALASIPVVVYSGFPEDAPLARALGIAAHVLKPALPDKIAAVLVQHCAQRGAPPDSP
jgi:CheY-like chemotaxis protein